MAFDFQVTLDCADPHSLADWWAETLDWQVEPTDEAFIRRMVAEGKATESDTKTHNGKLVWAVGEAIVHPEGVKRAPRVLFMRVPEAKSTKNRMHLDVRVGDDALTTAVEKLTARGATVIGDGQQGSHRWVVLTDPEGNEFCVSP